jgi:DNA-binding MarR family transcriptional regulator
VRNQLEKQILSVQAAFPRIYLACHQQHQPVGHRGETLSDKDSRILAHLDGERPLAPAALAKHLRIQRSTLSEALDRLVKRGLVSRAIRADDRRRLDLRLTERGAAAMSGSSVLAPDRLARLLEALSPAERVLAVQGLELLAEGARRLSEGGG